jgi:hypothetical protein
MLGNAAIGVVDVNVNAMDEAAACATFPGVYTRYIVTTPVNIEAFCVFTRYKSRYRPSTEA